MTVATAAARQNLAAFDTFPLGPRQDLADALRLDENPHVAEMDGRCPSRPSWPPSPSTGRST